MPFRHVEGFTIETVAKAKNRPWIGKTIGSYAAATGKAPFDALLDLAIEEDLRLWFSYDTLQDDDESWDMRASAWVDARCIIGGSDAGAHLDMLNTFAFSTEFLANGVRRRGLLSLEEAVRRMTRVPADCFGLTARGRLEIGAFADIVVFDPETVGVGPIEIRSDLPAGESRIYAEATGVPHVIVNGTPVIRDGTITGKLGGRILKSGRDTHTVSI
jgi:N-acyl-D-aspartate/D-glutamate deacylase